MEPKEKKATIKEFVQKHKKKLIAGGAAVLGIAGVFLARKYVTREEYNITINVVDDIPIDEDELAE